MDQLQFITHTNDRYSTLEGARLALAGGCRWIQLRMKDADDDMIITTAHSLRELTLQYGAKLILDDKVHLVKATGCDGVHLGKTDMPVAEARNILGPDVIIGATANCLDDMIHAVEAGADYIGLGPFRFTTTKKKLSPILGLDGYRRIMHDFHSAGYTTPVVAIGGIVVDDIPDLMATEIDGIALSGEILRADNPQHKTTEIMNSIRTCH